MPEQGDYDTFVSELTGAQRRLWAYLFTILGSRDLADECLQETNVVLWRKADQFTPGTDFGAWAGRVAQLQAKALRKRMRRSRSMLSDEAFDRLCDAASRIDSERDVRVQALRACLENLTDRQFEALRAFYGRNAPLASIGTTLGTTARAAKSLLHRTRRDLLECVNRRMEGGVGG